MVPDSCPACFRMPTQREHMKALIAREEKGNPRLVKNLLNTMRPLMGGVEKQTGSDARDVRVGEFA